MLEKNMVFLNLVYVSEVLEVTYGNVNVNYVGIQIYLVDLCYADRTLRCPVENNNMNKTQIKAT